MAFVPKNLISTDLGNSNGVPVRSHFYDGGADSLATIETAPYFALAATAKNLGENDPIYIVSSSGTVFSHRRIVNALNAVTVDVGVWA